MRRWPCYEKDGVEQEEKEKEKEKRWDKAGS